MESLTGRQRDVLGSCLLRPRCRSRRSSVGARCNVRPRSGQLQRPALPRLASVRRCGRRRPHLRARRFYARADGWFDSSPRQPDRARSCARPVAVRASRSWSRVSPMKPEIVHYGGNCDAKERQTCARLACSLSTAWATSRRASEQALRRRSSRPSWRTSSPRRASNSRTPWPRRSSSTPPHSPRRISRSQSSPTAAWRRPPGRWRGPRLFTILGGATTPVRDRAPRRAPTFSGHRLPTSPSACVTPRVRSAAR